MGSQAGAVGGCRTGAECKKGAQPLNGSLEEARETHTLAVTAMNAFYSLAAGDGGGDVDISSLLSRVG